jgi:hypothetical protein
LSDEKIIQRNKATEICFLSFAKKLQFSKSKDS